MKKLMFFLGVIYLIGLVAVLATSPNISLEFGLATLVAILTGGVIAFIGGTLGERQHLNRLKEVGEAMAAELRKNNEGLRQRLLAHGCELEELRKLRAVHERKILGLTKQLTDAQIPLLDKVEYLAEQMADETAQAVPYRREKQRRTTSGGHDDGATIQQASLISALTTPSSPLRNRSDDLCANPNRDSDYSPTPSYSSSSDSGSSCSSD